MIPNIKEDWIDNHIYFSGNFSQWLRKHNLNHFHELEQFNLRELLDADGMTLPRLKKIIDFMLKNGLSIELGPKPTNEDPGEEIPG